MKILKCFSISIDNSNFVYEQNCITHIKHEKSHLQEENFSINSEKAQKLSHNKLSDSYLSVTWKYFTQALKLSSFKECDWSSLLSHRKEKRETLIVETMERQTVHYVNSSLYPLWPIISSVAYKRENILH